MPAVKLLLLLLFDVELSPKRYWWGPKSHEMCVCLWGGGGLTVSNTLLSKPERFCIKTGSSDFFFFFFFSVSLIVGGGGGERVTKQCP